MKTSLILFIVLYFCLHTKAQVPGLDTASCIYSPGFSLPNIDTVYTFCDTFQASNFNAVIEPGPDNRWQRGRTIKFGNIDIRDTTCAIITDTLNTYPINNYSAFHFLLPQTPGQSLFSYYLKFWHKFETDSLLDGCWLEFSSDSGANWYPADSFFYGPPQGIFDYCNLYSKNINWPLYFDTLQDGKKAWSGSSYGWQYTALHLNYSLPFKPHRSSLINAIRFVFQSDSIDNNKPGWIINNVSIGHVLVNAWGVNDLIQYNQLPVYPNPSSSIFNISYPDNYVKGTIQLYNIYGQKIIDKPLSTTLDLNNYNNGIYYYKASFDGKYYSGVLSKN